jgi:cell division protein FtsL
VVLSIGIVFGALLASAVFHALLAQGQQRLDRVDQQVTQAQQDYDRLRLNVDRLSAPERIVSEAERLGMVAPGKVQPITPAAGAGASVPNVPGVDAPTSGQGTTGYTKVKPYLGVDR